MTHDELCLMAESFLKRNGYGVVFNDRFRAFTKHGEQPDAIGFRSGVSCLIECKTSRADFLADRKKRFRRDPTIGMGDWRFMMVPKGMIRVDELPEGWGLLEVSKGRVYKTHGWPPNTIIHTSKPFKGCRDSEIAMMYSALRRMVVRNHFREIYDVPPEAK